MATTSRAFAAMRAFKALLDADPTLIAAEVVVFTARPGAQQGGEHLPDQAIVMYGWDADQEWAALGRESREERFEIPCSCVVTRDGASEAVVQEVQDAITVIIAAIETALRPQDTGVSLSGTVRTAEFADAKAHQGFNDKSRWCEIEFTIRCAVRLRP